MGSAVYTKEYYSEITRGSLQSAEATIPVILQFITPSSVADIGCGTGSWLSVWTKHGVTDICGYDGAYIDREQLLIDKDKFVPVDIETGIPISKKFDLVMSLEVAEHIHPENASVFIRSLCDLGNVILFSAAIPHQGGLNHFNEQYPEYWMNLFSENGYTAYDCIREKIWNNKNIDTCYRQNIFFFVSNSAQRDHPLITTYRKPVLALVHPEHYELKQRNISDYQKILRSPFHAWWYLFKKFWKNILTKSGLWK